MCALNKYSFIHHVNIDRSCLNKSKIHLNAKGSALLPASFINFIRGRKKLSQINQSKNFWMEETLRQLGAVLANQGGLSIYVSRTNVPFFDL